MVCPGICVSVPARLSRLGCQSSFPAASCSAHAELSGRGGPPLRRGRHRPTRLPGTASAGYRPASARLHLPTFLLPNPHRSINRNRLIAPAARQGRTVTPSGSSCPTQLVRIPRPRYSLSVGRTARENAPRVGKFAPAPVISQHGKATVKSPATSANVRGCGRLDIPSTSRQESAMQSLSHPAEILHPRLSSGVRNGRVC